jgi:hypothetical protein
MNPRNALIALVVVPLALAAAGCGGSGGPSVANLGSGDTTTTTQGDSPSSSGGSANSGSSGGPQLSLRTENGARFSACMRSHGVHNFPDPNGQGGITIGPGSGVNPDSPTFQAAQRICQKLLPNGGTPSPAQVAKARSQALAFSACMRKHGVPDFPDPQFSGGRISIRVKGGKGSDLSPSSPVFQAAQKACQSKLPGKLGGGR